MKEFKMKPCQLLWVATVLVTSLSGVVGAVAYGGAAAELEDQSPRPAADTEGSIQEVVGTLRSVKGSELTIQTPTGRVVKVDATTAIKGHRSNVLMVGHAFSARGVYDRKGVLHADTVWRAKGSSGAGPASQ